MSNGLRVYGATPAIAAAKIGDQISLSGVVSGYQQAGRYNDLFVAELIRPSNVVTMSRGHSVVPVLLGRDRIPPTTGLSALDLGPDGWLSLPNNVTQVDRVNATLDPRLYGLDFWHSLDGQLVTIPSPVALNFLDRMGTFWVHGDWPVNGKNGRGGVTLALGLSPGVAHVLLFNQILPITGEDGVPYTNSEAILIGHALDRSRSPQTIMGTTLQDITGILTYQVKACRRKI